MREAFRSLGISNKGGFWPDSLINSLQPRGHQLHWQGRRPQRMARSPRTGKADRGAEASPPEGLCHRSQPVATMPADALPPGVSVQGGAPAREVQAVQEDVPRATSSESEQAARQKGSATQRARWTFRGAAKVGAAWSTTRCCTGPSSWTGLFQVQVSTQSYPTGTQIFQLR